MIVLILFLLGLCLGSFVNAFVYRFHINNRQAFGGAKAGKKSVQKLSIVNGRSMCVDCNHQLTWYDLVPLLSWISLQGKCRYCKSSISIQYPLIELTTALLFVISYLQWPWLNVAANVVAFGFWLVFVVGFMALTLFDIKWMILPNKVVYSLIGVFLVQVLTVSLLGGFSLIGLAYAAIAAVIISGLFWLLFQVSQGKWIGGGDVKLGILLGLLAGTPAKAFLVIFLASLLGAIIGSLLLVIGHRFKIDRQIPFGPYLMGATFIVVLWGSSMISSYMNFVVG